MRRVWITLTTFCLIAIVMIGAARAVSVQTAAPNNIDMSCPWTETIYSSQSCIPDLIIHEVLKGSH